MQKLFTPAAFVAVLFGCFAELQAQNLVLNPGFETLFSCPTGFSQFMKCHSWNQLNNAGSNCPTPDLFAACAPAGGFTSVNAPSSYFGYQPTHGGSNFAGIILVEQNFPTAGCDSAPVLGTYREYIQGQLSSPLLAGEEYCVTFFVSLADSAKWGTDGIGLYFSNTPVQQDCSNPTLTVTPQLQYSGAPIMDKVNWTKLQWNYTAAGGEQHFVIGNFLANNVFQLQDNHCATLNAYAYYFIDDVSVKPGACDSCPNINVSLLPKVDVLCHGASTGMAGTKVTGGVPPYTYGWSPVGTYNHAANNLPAGTYTVVVSDSNFCYGSHTFTITQPPALNAPVSVVPQCGNTPGSVSVNASGGVAPYTYSWNPSGATTSSLIGLAPGSYAVTVTDANNCTMAQSASVVQVNALTLSSVTTPSACGAATGSATVNVSGGAPPYTFNWSGGQTTQTVNNLASGTYTVTVGFNAGAAPPFWTEDFTTGGTGWTLNLNGPGTNGPNPNVWVINSSTDCPCGTGNYAHITCSASVFCPGGGNCFYVSAPVTPFGDATTDKFITSPNISTIGKSGITLGFKYESEGEAGNDYGLVRLSNDGGATWNDLPTQYYGTFNCTNASVSIPAQYENINNFKIGFRWVNNANGSGSSPGFSIDDITLRAAADVACPNVAVVQVGTTGSLTGNFSVLQPSCGQSDGTITCTGFTGGTAPYTVQWFNNGNSIGTTMSITNLDSGLYVFSATDAAGCSTDTSFYFPGGGTGNVPIGPNLPVICSGDSVQVCAPPGYAAYSWNNGATTSCTWAKLPGNYWVTVTDNGNCTAMSNLLPLSIYPVSPVSVSVKGDTLTSYNAVSYQWFFNGSLIAGATSPVYVATQTGNYSVQIVDGNGCTATSNNIYVQVTGLTEGEGIQRVKIYPNPTYTDWFLEAGKDWAGSTLQVFDNTGALVYYAAVAEGVQQIQLTVPVGVYTGRIVSARQILTYKLVKW
ncbi:MAG: T9SS type A sorting domain-containing protein [Chitinophagales bacterium]|nr:T9SS type A sorting domain-containing protein [Chitinophagales bacterium]